MLHFSWKTRHSVCTFSTRGSCSQHSVSLMCVLIWRLQVSEGRGVSSTLIGTAFLCGHTEEVQSIYTFQNHPKSWTGPQGGPHLTPRPHIWHPRISGTDFYLNKVFFTVWYWYFCLNKQNIIAITEIRMQMSHSDADFPSVTVRITQLYEWRHD